MGPINGALIVIEAFLKKKIDTYENYKNCLKNQLFFFFHTKIFFKRMLLWNSLTNSSFIRRQRDEIIHIHFSESKIIYNY